MKLHELSDNEGARHNSKRVGRGIGSGKGKTAGRGHKGQKSRAGATVKGFEGGQMPLYRRVPKRGFTNVFRKSYAEVNVGRLQEAIDAKKLDASKTIDSKALVASGVVRRVLDGVRLLAKGELNAKITIEVAGASKSAIELVEKAGGKVVVTAAAAEAEKPAKKTKSKAKAEETPADGENEASDDS
jgi:large subunit ribosomal protein L15